MCISRQNHFKKCYNPDQLEIIPFPDQLSTVLVLQCIACSIRCYLNDIWWLLARAGLKATSIAVYYSVWILQCIAACWNIAVYRSLLEYCSVLQVVGIVPPCTQCNECQHQHLFKQTSSFCKQNKQFATMETTSTNYYQPIWAN